MILDRRLYKSLPLIKKTFRTIKFYTKNVLKVFLNIERKKGIDYPREKYTYSPRYRYGAKALKCPQCNKPGVKIELIYAGNTLKKSFVGECVECFHYWAIEKN